MRRFLVVSILVLVSFAAAAWAREALPLRAIEVVGNEHISREDIVVASGLVKGEPVDAAEIRRASERIEQMGYFAGVGRDMEIVDDEIIARFTVREYALLERITLRGVPQVETGTLWAVVRSLLVDAPRVSEAKIRSILEDHGVAPGEVLNARKLNEALEKVLEEYRERDLVTVQIGELVPGKELVIGIQELPVLGHRFTGLETVPEEDALQYIDVPEGETGRLSKIRESANRLLSSVYFTHVDMELEPGEGGVWLRWKVTENQVLAEPAVVTNIELSGVEALSPEQVKGRLRELPAGEVTNFEVLQALSSVHDYYRREGFLMLRMDGELEGELLRITLHEGKLGDVEITGNTRTSEHVIRRVLDLREGEFLTQARLRRAQQSLMELGYFADVQVDPKWAEDTVALKLSVKELERLGHIRGAMTYSPQKKGLVGHVEYAQKNILGTAQDVSVSLERGLAGTGATTWSLGYRGYAFAAYDVVEADLYRREEGGVVTLGGEFMLSYPLAPYWSVRTTLLSERSWEVEDGDPLQPRTAVRTGLLFNDRDSPIFPRRGSRLALSVEKAGTFAPGAEYLSLRGELARYWPLDVDTALWEGRAALAQRLLVRTGWDLPARYRFTLGGVDTVRGATPTSVDGLALLNTEIRFELAQGFAFAGFWDVGTALDRPHAVSSLGVELSGHVAGMFVRLAMAWPDDREPTWVPMFEFGMSPMF